ncbi:aminoglycoside phosphotransferase family protein [Fulvivirgaceae bacterium BMA12]|uniref:Aminoglycoside phosphotransferase family protein n=1 Tax=Agaribacillus aureus TaxID=3051825 RepID=A0ABT8L825_9BACT|nr:aminoglycoside phosphotransferase family protein [Fulvivirgaceae bacterium BMA12]
MSEENLINRLFEKGLIRKKQNVATQLTGGVSCQILLIDDGENRFVVKRALEKLKVKDNWYADTGRNKTEQAYLSYVGEFLPGAVPKVIYSDDTLNFFCMEMLENGLSNWKDLLMTGQCDQRYAEKTGALLGEIHAHSAGDTKAKALFDTSANFHQLRIEPYLLKTGERNPQLQDIFRKEAERIANTSTCLVHGDFSPKNIMVRQDRIVVLDCEVAWYGDPVFDIAFLLNHFMLKALYLPKHTETLLNMAASVWDNYRHKAQKILDVQFEKRMTHLLLLLMLARVDGKSPVEYLNDKQQNQVKDFVCGMFPQSFGSFRGLQDQWLENLKQ